jgi:selenocysteine-specific elongation factor
MRSTPETLELAVEEAQELVPGAEVIAVSAKTGAGLDDLKAALSRAADLVLQEHNLDSSVDERGAASTSIACSRCAGSERSRQERSGRDRSAPATCFVPSPAGATIRVRSVQVHDRSVERADPGQRVASRSRASSGTSSAGRRAAHAGRFATSYRLDVALEELAPIADGAALHVHHGIRGRGPSAAVCGRAVLVSRGFALAPARRRRRRGRCS